MKKTKFSKKAFTLVEMLVCMVCIAFLTMAVASFHETITNQTLMMKQEEEASLLEHSDISRLRTSKTIDADLISTLNHTTYINKVVDINMGHPLAIEHGFDLLENQTVIFESADLTIIAVDETTGNVTGLRSGITYITATLCNIDDNGQVSKTLQSKRCPVRIYEDDTSELMTSFDMYYYQGKYYTGWFISDATGGVTP